MNAEQLRQLLQAVARREVPVDEAVARLRELPYADLSFSKLDLHRSLRTGLPEVVFCEGKTADQVAGIFARLAQEGEPVLGTRASAEQFAAVAGAVPLASYDALARTISVGAAPARRGRIAVVCAGTADLPVAEEAARTAETTGYTVQRVYDVGVAGLHRLLAHLDDLRAATVVIAVAGMDGALPTVLAGLIAQPIVAVPTSVGYGTGLGGIAALLTMLNGCAPGVAVVNIDNGFGAACAALRICQTEEA